MIKRLWLVVAAVVSFLSIPFSTASTTAATTAATTATTVVHQLRMVDQLCKCCVIVVRFIA